MLCQKIIPLEHDPKGRMMSNTYCMRPMGHKGKCEQEPQPEDNSLPLTNDLKSDKL